MYLIISRSNYLLLGLHATVLLIVEVINYGVFCKPLDFVEIACCPSSGRFAKEIEYHPHLAKGGDSRE